MRLNAQTLSAHPPLSLLVSKKGIQVTHFPLHGLQLIGLLIELVLAGYELKVLEFDHFLETVAFEGFTFQNLEVPRAELRLHSELADPERSLFPAEDIWSRRLGERLELNGRRILDLEMRDWLFLYQTGPEELPVFLLQELYFPLLFQDDFLQLFLNVLVLGLLLPKGIDFPFEFEENRFILFFQPPYLVCEAIDSVLVGLFLEFERILVVFADLLE